MINLDLLEKDPSLLDFLTQEEKLFILKAKKPKPLDFEKDPSGFIKNYYPDVTLEAWQEDVCSHISHKLTTDPFNPIKMSIVSARGCGKAELNSNEVLTTNGWSTISALKVGDKVFDEVGNPTTVTGIFPQNPQQCYKFIFSDNTEVVIGEEHLWNTWTCRDRMQFNRRNKGKFPPPNWPMYQQSIRTGGFCGPTVKTTREIVSTFTHSKREDTNHSIPLCKPLNLPKQDLLIDPYLFGLWIGDGSTNSGGITCGLPDVDHYKKAILTAGYNIGQDRRVKSLTGSAHTLHILGFIQDLKKISAETKIIPNSYLFGSIEQRLALLRGLLDSDGYANNDKLEFTSINRAHAEAVVWLARSLGEKPVLSEGIATLYGKDCGPKYRVTWRSCNFNPFTLPRKADNITFDNTAQQSRNNHRMIVSYEDFGVRDDLTCISVDSPNHLYLTSRALIPTHNSFLVSMLSIWALCTHPHSCRGVVTAVTDTQLRTKTFVEVATWWQRSQAIRDILDMTATSIFSKDPIKSKINRIDAIPWNKNNTAAFAGLHNLGGRILLLMDESSGIDDVIFTTTEGVLFDKNTQIIWLLTGNGTRNKGYFFNTHKQPTSWYTKSIDARNTNLSNKDEIQRQIEAVKDQGGEENDYVRVHIRGLFTLNEIQGLYPVQLIDAKILPSSPLDTFNINRQYPLVYGLDVAKSLTLQNDATILSKLNHTSIFGIKEYRNPNPVSLCRDIATEFHIDDADGIVVDAGGLGHAFPDILRSTNPPVPVVVGVTFQQSAYDQQAYQNLRAEMAFKFLNWLSHPDTKVYLPHNLCVRLKEEMQAISYFTNVSSNKLQIQSKDEIKLLIGRSPDILDSIFCLFGAIISPIDRYTRTLRQLGFKVEKEYECYYNLSEN